MSSKDIHKILDGWAYQPGQVSVRLIHGFDGHPKIQMRINLGILQMEIIGRPDGQHPHGCESILQYHMERRQKYHHDNGTDLGFTIDPEESQEIREEAYQYYQRYLANFVLENYSAVARDTKRNLDALEFCKTYAAEDGDRYAMEVYRPYIVMMYSQSLALLAMQDEAYRVALKHTENGLKAIREFFKNMRQPKGYHVCPETRILKSLRREIKRHLPVNRSDQLRKRLKQAIEKERYEEAAHLRDELDDYLRNQQHAAD